MRLKETTFPRERVVSTPPLSPPLHNWMVSGTPDSWWFYQPSRHTMGLLSGYGHARRNRKRHVSTIVLRQSFLCRHGTLYHAHDCRLHESQMRERDVRCEMWESRSSIKRLFRGGEMTRSLFVQTNKCKTIIAWILLAIGWLNKKRRNSTVSAVFCLNKKRRNSTVSTVFV